MAERDRLGQLGQGTKRERVCAGCHRFPILVRGGAGPRGSVFGRHSQRSKQP